MKANETPEKIYLDSYGSGFSHGFHTNKLHDNDVEYIRKDSFIEKVANYLNYTLYDRVEIVNPGTIIPSLCAKGEFIEDLKNYVKGE